MEKRSEWVCYRKCECPINIRVIYSVSSLKNYGTIHSHCTRTQGPGVFLMAVFNSILLQTSDQRMHPAFQLEKPQLDFPFSCILGHLGSAEEERGEEPLRGGHGPDTEWAVSSLSHGGSPCAVWGILVKTVRRRIISVVYRSVAHKVEWVVVLQSGEGPGLLVGFMTWTRFFSIGNGTNFCLFWGILEQ